MSCTIGWTLALLSVVCFLAIPWYLIQPLLLAVTNDVADVNYGIVHVESVADGFAQYVLIIPAFVLWWLHPPS